MHFPTPAVTKVFLTMELTLQPLVYGKQQQMFMGVYIINV